MRNLLNDLCIKLSEPTPIYEDNQGCIQLSEKPGDHRLTKHIDTPHNFIREKVLGVIILKYIETEKQLADILTKGLPAFKFNYLVNLIMN